jgi:catechol 2,3-dioxygenase-like lactoylglutathione lyase family enzyme
VSGAVGLNHVSVVAHDLEESVRFYVDVVGLESLRRPTSRSGAVKPRRRAQVTCSSARTNPPTPARSGWMTVAVYGRARLGSSTMASASLRDRRASRRRAQLYIRDPAGNLRARPSRRAAGTEIEEMILLSAPSPTSRADAAASSPNLAG